MRIAEINMTANGSTGKIMLQIAQVARERGHDVRTYSAHLYTRHPKKLSDIDGHTYFGSQSDGTFHYVIGRLTGKNGMLSRGATKRLIKMLQKQKIDILHLHNLHYFCINLPMLFRYVKDHNIRVIWTLHDCWAFTGHCPYFDIVNCGRWKSGCHSCPQYRSYPTTMFDDSVKMYRKKKEWFTGVRDMTLVTPSAWLAGLVKQSFLKDYPVEVIPNGIDLNVFKPTDGHFQAKYGLEGKKIVLGVALGWGIRKGLDVFEKLAERLPDDYQIVLVGTDDQIDAHLSGKILSIHRTDNQQELAKLYTAADVFVNPTREDNYPTVNMEAIACGTPVITFRTGGSPEMVGDVCGSVVEKEDIDGMEREILRICEEKIYTREECVTYAQCFDKANCFEKYVCLYDSSEEII